jgi:protein-S-isoprenylcysteine O-methyltransferase Ste14
MTQSAPVAAPARAETAASVSATRPASAVSHGVGVAGLVGLLGWLGVARYYGMDGILSALSSVLFCGVGMVGWSLLVDKVHRNPSTGIDWDVMRARGRDTAEISSYKLLGLWATWAIIAFLYMVLRYYGAGNYPVAMGILTYAVGPMVLLSVPYVIWLDRRLIEPRDGAYAFGRWLAGQAVDVPGDSGSAGRDAIYAHLRAWAVKGFFLAFMLSVVLANFAPLITTPFANLADNPVALGQFGLVFLYMLDVHFAIVGYVLTMRPLDTHIREANPYATAWVAALICYPPFVLMSGGGLLNYEVNIAGGWTTLLAGYPWLLWLWAGALFVLTAIYTWATIAFGPRFSNLTHRGIITHGPYAWTRHPAYVSKNLSWWLVTIPMYSNTITDAVRNTVLLAVVSGVYYWRAKTEEQQLLADPAYRAYWTWAQQHAIIPRLFKRFNGQDKPLITLIPRHERDYSR